MPTGNVGKKRPPPLAAIYGQRLAKSIAGKSPFSSVSSGSSPAAGHIAPDPELKILRTGPVFSRHPRGKLPLSSFCVPVGPTDCESLVIALNRALNAVRESTPPPRVAQLMQRTLLCDALHVRQQVKPLHLEHSSASRKQYIVLIDERETSYADICTPARHRITIFRTMLDAIRSSSPDMELWLFRSADAGKGRWLSAYTKLPTGTRILDVSHSLHEVLQHAQAVFAVGASEGMGALLANVPTRIYGSPYYSGWGLTQDYIDMPERSARPPLWALFEVAFLNLTRYLDPFNHCLGTLETALDCIELQHQIATRFSDLNSVAGLRFQWWKRAFATPYLTAGGGSLRWVRRNDDFRPGEQAAIWGGRSANGLPSGISHFRMEDGFIHSAGLGSDMSPPFSQVIDRRGIYFDASRPSDLTDILNHTTFDDAELLRAEKLKLSIIRSGITKYNLGRRKPAWQAPSDKQIILVIGQVADDASIRLGTGNINTSEALLDAVRARRPDAFIVYKPHPDVLSGNRTGLINASDSANVVDTDADVISLIEASNELHTLSSLAGFDALIRGKAVFTYGLPFYAGWGLTYDALTQPWRTRRLSLDMLIAGVFFRYAVYWDWDLDLFTTPESIVRRLATPSARPLVKIRQNRLRPVVKAIRWIRNAQRHVAWRTRRLFAV
ncbi:capsular polysaccharide export protein, LipB/KpsS family [Burkholderia cenocepacia]|uniref:capsular polysaccharide export protein, LipB/KpsS family n=2 Tax=Burkholderia cenocepacia TaxID=95486 RepID=UPI00396B2E61